MKSGIVFDYLAFFYLTTVFNLQNTEKKRYTILKSI